MRTGGLCLHNRVLGVSIQVLHWMLTYIGNWILVLDSVGFGRASMVAFMACLTMRDTQAETRSWMKSW